MKVLYVRCSSIDQKTDRQRVSEKDYDIVIEDKCSGAIPFFDREGGFVFFPTRGKRNENAVPRRGNRERGKKSRRCAFLRLSFRFFEFERSHSKRTVPRAEEESRRHDEARKKKNGRRGASE